MITLVYFAANDITDNSKKIKKNTDGQFYETSFISTVTNAVTHNTNNTNDTSNINNTDKQQNKSTFANKSNKIDENDKDPLKCKSEIVNDITTPILSYQKNDLPIQSILVPKTNDMRHVSQIVSYLDGNNLNVNSPNVNVAVNIQQSNGNTEYVTVSKSNPVYVPVNRFYLEQIPNPFEPINQSADNTNIYAIPSSGIILPHVTDNITVLNQTMLVNPPIVTSVTAPILNNNRIIAVKHQKPASKGNVSASMSSAGNSSSNNFYVSNSLSKSRIYFIGYTTWNIL